MIKDLCISKKYNNRSEFIRKAVKNFLNSELEFIKNLDQNGHVKWAKILTVNLVKDHLEILEELKGTSYPSISEIIRIAVHDQLKRELKDNEKEEIEEYDKNEIRIPNGKTYKILREA